MNSIHRYTLYIFSNIGIQLNNVTNLGYMAQALDKWVSGMLYLRYERNKK